MQERTNMRKYIVTFIVVFSISAFFNMVSDKTIVNAAVKKKVVTVTLDKENVSDSFKVDVKGRHTSWYVKIKVLSKSGKVSSDSALCFYYSYDDNDPLICDVTDSSLKKGHIFKGEHGISGDGHIDVNIPKGLNKLKVKFIFYTDRKSINSVEKNS